MQKEVRRMQRKLGGDVAVEKIASQFIKFANDSKKKSARSSFSFKFDLVDSCERGSAVKALPMLAFGADANSTSSQDEPLLITVFCKVMAMDAEGTEIDLGSSGRKAYMRILSGLVQYGADVNSLGGNEKMAPLHLCALVGNIELLKWCLSQPKIKVGVYVCICV